MAETACLWRSPTWEVYFWVPFRETAARAAVDGGRSRRRPLLTSVFSDKFPRSLSPVPVTVFFFLHINHGTTESLVDISLRSSRQRCLSTYDSGGTGVGGVYRKAYTYSADEARRLFRSLVGMAAGCRSVARPSRSTHSDLDRSLAAADAVAKHIGDAVTTLRRRPPGNVDGGGCGDCCCCCCC